MGDKQSKGAAPVLAPEGSGDIAAGTPAEFVVVPAVGGFNSEVPECEVPPDGNAKTNEGENGEQSPAMPSESEILAKLVAYLGQAKDRRVPLSQIRESLPASLKPFAEDTQSIVKWLARFGGLFEVVGEPGQEEVVLDLGGGNKPAATTATTATTGATTSSVVETASPEVESSSIMQTGTDFPDDESLSACTVQLRGLPFRAQVQDIKAFLGVHAEQLTIKDQSIRLLLNRDGRPSGFARVQFVSPEAAKAAREALHKTSMGDRYVEVLACSDRAGKARHRRAIAAEVEAMEAPGTECVMDSTTEAVERERVLQECRDHMRMPGRHQILLSMLGIALSPAARNYLRRLNLGLKHFLARFPAEFRVEGPKGCEQVIWMPNAAEGFYPDAMMAEAMAAAWMAPPLGEMADPTLLASPTPHKMHNQHCMATPSDWGTPGSGGHTIQANTDSSTQSGAGSGSGTAAELDQVNTFNANAWANANFGFGPPWGASGWPGWPGQDMLELDAKGDKVKGAAGKQRSTGKGETPAARSHAHLHPQSHPFAHKPPSALGNQAAANQSGTAPGAATTEAGGLDSNVAAVRLRGLPFSMSVQDVLAFFAQYDVADRIADGPQAAQLLPKANGRPSGQARVQMRTRYDAEVAQQALNNQWIGGRYIEVFVYGEESEQSADAQLGYPAQSLAPESQKQFTGDAAAQAWQRAAAGGFPPLAFPGMPFGPFPGASPMLGAPPWAQMAGQAFPGVPGADSQPPMGANLDNLFSFLYTEKYDGEGAETAGTPTQRNAVQV
jgi:hypothetical protein